MNNGLVIRKKISKKISFEELLLMLKAHLKNLLPVFIINYLTQGNSRSIKAKKNIAFSFIIKGLSISISLVLVPLTIHYINPTRYGIWLTLSSIIGWLTFFDIGFGNGLRNKFAEAVAEGKHELARIYVSTTYAILIIIIAFALILFFIINPFLNWSKILNSPVNMANELGLLALVVFVFFCIQFVLQLITIVTTANQQPAKASLFNFLGSLLSLTIIFILTKTTSGNLVYLALVLGLMPVLVLLISTIWLYTHEYRRYAPAIEFVQFSYARDLMGLGVKFFVIQIAAMVLYQSSNIIIAQLFGPAEVTPFNIAYQYFGVISMIMGTIMMPFWSAFTEAWIKKDFEWIRNSMRKLKKIWVILSALTILMLVFSTYIYKIWVGKEIQVPMSISLVMAGYVIIYTWSSINGQFLNGVGKIKLQLIIAVIAGILNIPLAIFLGKQIGISGVLLANLILGLLGVFIFQIQYRKIITNKATGIWNK